MSEDAIRVEAIEEGADLVLVIGCDMGVPDAVNVNGVRFTPAPTESGEPLGWVVVECTKQLHIASGGFLFTRERADAEAAAMRLRYPLLTFTVAPVGARPGSESAGEVERLRRALEEPKGCPTPGACSCLTAGR